MVRPHPRVSEDRYRRMNLLGAIVPFRHCSLGPRVRPIVNLAGGRNLIGLQVVIACLEKFLGMKRIIAGKPFHIADRRNRFYP